MVGKIIQNDGAKAGANEKAAKTQAMRLPAIRKVYFKPSQVAIGVTVFILTVFFARVAIWEHGYLARMEGSERAVSALSAETEGGDEVDKTVPTTTEVAEYIVAPDKPRYMNIPRIGLTQARIVEIGIQADGQLGTPNNIYDVGWYNRGGLPGSNEVVMIDAHGGMPGAGAFGNLPQVRRGDEIKVTMGDGREFTYVVADTATKALGEEADNYMTTAFESPEAGRGSMTLITCTGVYWANSRTYSHRFFARAVLK